jgi:hypothetical protein
MTSAITPSRIRAIPNNVCGSLAPGKPKAKFKAPIIAMNVNMTREANDAPITITCIALFNSLFKRIPKLATVIISVECEWKKNWSMSASLNPSSLKPGATIDFQTKSFKFSSKVIYSGTSKGLWQSARDEN